MKILLYLDPWVDINSDKPEFKMAWFNIFISSTIRKLVDYTNLSNDSNLEIKGICSDISKVSIKEECKFIEFKSISNNQLRSIFADFEEYINLQRGGDNQKFFSLNKLVIDCLNGFFPDIIIPISSFAKYLKYAFPKALILFNETGIFSRAPFPHSLYFDCSASMDESFLLRFSDELLALECDDSQKLFLQKNRNFFLPTIKNNSPFKSKIELLRKEYKHIVLLALQNFYSPMFRLSCEHDFKDQIEYLKYVFDNIDESVGVIVTEHSLDRILNFEVIKNYFCEKYKNFIYIDEVEEIKNPSQFLLMDVDAVITISSTVGLQALFYKKPLFVPSKISYLSAFCDGDDLNNIKNFLDGNHYKDKDGVLYYMLTRYYVTSEYFNNGEWFYNFLVKSLNNFKKGIGTDFYDRIDSDDNLRSVICNEKRLEKICGIKRLEQLPKNHILPNKRPNFIQKIKRSIEKRLEKIRK